MYQWRNAASIYNRGIDIILIKLSENRANTHMQHTEHWTAVSTLLGLISSAYHNLHHLWSNQQPQNAETELLPMGRQFMPHISDAKLTSHGKNARPLDHMYLESTFLPYRGHDHL